MSAENFLYWLNGYIEMGGQRPTDEQWLMIKEHLALAIFKKTIATVTQSGPTYVNPAKPMELVC